MVLKPGYYQGPNWLENNNGYVPEINFPALASVMGVSIFIDAVVLQWFSTPLTANLGEKCYSNWLF